MSKKIISLMMLLLTSHVWAVEIAAPIALNANQTEQSAEIWFDNAGSKAVRNVTVATLTPVFPEKNKATGRAVLVIPGGAFRILSIEAEGFEIARWLAEQGITAFVLKYRLHQTPIAEKDFRQAFAKAFVSAMKGELEPYPASLEDGRMALNYLQQHAAQFGFKAEQLGVIGFSAGAHVAMEAALTGQQKPAFIGFVYGRMFSRDIPKDAPPLFAVLASDDVLYGRRGFSLIESWLQAKRPVEFHFYQRGGHGFGIGMDGTTTEQWPASFMQWLKMNFQQSK